jgi:hypothetical protein
LRGRRGGGSRRVREPVSVSAGLQTTNAEDAGALLASGAGHRCGIGDRLNVEPQHSSTEDVVFPAARINRCARMRANAFLSAIVQPRRRKVIFFPRSGTRTAVLALVGASRGETAMNKRMIIGSILLAAIATPAAAAEFYIVQDSGTKRCTIVDKKPTTTTTVVVGDGKVYTTRTEAETAMKTVKVCDSK